MKRLILIVSAICMLAGFAIADNIQLAGKTYTVTINDGLYYAEFVQGPFGPGESGTVVLSGLWDTVDLGYTFDPPICDISGYTFVLIGNRLESCVLDKALIFTEVQP